MKAARDFPRARGESLSRIGDLWGVNRKWYEVKYLLDFLYRERITKYLKDWHKEKSK